MSSTFMDHNYVLIKDTLGELVTAYPWLFALALFTLSILLFSQAATTKALMPLGLVTGIVSGLPGWNFSGCERSLFYSGISNPADCNSI